MNMANVYDKSDVWNFWIVEAIDKWLKKYLENFKKWMFIIFYYSVKFQL